MPSGSALIILSIQAATRAIESESEIAFAGLSDVLRPFLPLISSLPGTQADALSGALQLGPPRPGDPFAIYTASLGLLALAAEKCPVLVGVDDAHWLDIPLSKHSYSSSDACVRKGWLWC